MKVCCQKGVLQRSWLILDGTVAQIMSAQLTARAKQGTVSKKRGEAHGAKLLRGLDLGGVFGG